MNKSYFAGIVAGGLMSFAGCNTLPVENQKCSDSSECGSGSCKVDLVGQLDTRVVDRFGLREGLFYHEFSVGGEKVYVDSDSYLGEMPSGTVRLEGELTSNGIRVAGWEDISYVNLTNEESEEIVGECR